MKLASLAMLIHQLMILAPAGLFAVSDWGNQIAHRQSGGQSIGFSEILYEFTSSSANNGSDLPGLQNVYGFNDPKANPSPHRRGRTKAVQWDIATGLVMLISRFVPIIAPIALAGCLSIKRLTPFTVGTLRTDTITFGFVLLGTILLVGGMLLFLPAAVLLTAQSPSTSGRKSRLEIEELNINHKGTNKPRRHEEKKTNAKAETLFTSPKPITLFFSSFAFTLFARETLPNYKKSRKKKARCKGRRITN